MNRILNFGSQFLGNIDISQYYGFSRIAMQTKRYSGDILIQSRFGCGRDLDVLPRTLNWRKI